MARGMGATPFRGAKDDAYPEDKFTNQEEITPRPSNSDRENIAGIER